MHHFSSQQTQGNLPFPSHPKHLLIFSDSEGSMIRVPPGHRPRGCRQPFPSQPTRAGLPVLIQRTSLSPGGTRHDDRLVVAHLDAVVVIPFWPGASRPLPATPPRCRGAHARRAAAHLRGISAWAAVSGAAPVRCRGVESRSARAGGQRERAAPARARSANPRRPGPSRAGAHIARPKAAPGLRGSAGCRPTASPPTPRCYRNGVLLKLSRGA